MRARTGEKPDGSRAPQRRRSVQSPDVQAFAEDDAGALKADAEYHLGRDQRRAGVAGKRIGKGHEARRTECYERIRAQSGEALAPLPFEADERAEAQRNC